jgi:hypothetical protein
MHANAHTPDLLRTHMQLPMQGCSQCLQKDLFVENK